MTSDQVRLDRLEPSAFHSRREVLRGLRKALEEALDRWVVGQDVEFVLDVGAGKAPYRSLVEPLVASYQTADLVQEEPDHVIAEDGRIPVGDGSVDLVLSTQVLEHVDDPDVHLAELFRLTRPGGRLFLSTHGYWMYHPTPEDYWRWTGSGLRRTISRAGFRVLSTRGVMGRAAAGVQLLQDGLMDRVPYRLRKPSAFVFQSLMRLVERWDRSDRTEDACVFMVVAERPGRAGGA